MNKILKFALISSVWLVVIGLLSFVNRTGTEEEKIVEITTEYGVMKLKLYNETPLHRDNFLKLIDEQYYDSLLFHRVMSRFMIQGGDPDSKNAEQNVLLGEGGPGYDIDPEFVSGLFHKKGALAAAREPDDVNPGKKSAGSQFYIVQGQKFDTLQLRSLEKRRVEENRAIEFNKYMHMPENKELLDRYMYALKNEDKITASGIMNEAKPIINQKLERFKFTPHQIEVYSTVGGAPHLDMAYTVYGELIEGWNVLDSIAAVPVDRYNRPLKDIKMTIRVIN